jgi:hypothetical protein
VLDPASAVKGVLSILYLRLDSRYGYRLRMMGASYSPLGRYGLHDPGLGGDPLTLRDTDLKESDNDRGETICQCR